MNKILENKVLNAIKSGLKHALYENANNMTIDEWYNRYFEKTEKDVWLEFFKEYFHEYFQKAKDGGYESLYHDNEGNEYTWEMEFMYKNDIRKFEKHENGYWIGYSYKDGKWYGWTHRGLHGFGIGDVACTCLPWGSFKGGVCETEDDCKEAAAKFAESMD